jgi:bifunctional non-homologous end joining protein LigD
LLSLSVPDFPALFPPMLATNGQPPFGRPGWVYEEKYDGWRAIAYKQGNGVALISRNMRNLLPRFPGIGRALAALAAPTLILDGEIAIFDEQLVSHLAYMKNEDGVRVTDACFVAFDCLFTRGKDLRDKPLKERRRALERVLARAESPIMIARRLDPSGPHAWQDVKRRGVEGLVAKDESSIYVPGQRTDRWIKVKHRIRQGWPEEKIERRRA